MDTKEKAFNPEQLDIIIPRGKSMLVSASAGSGKTTTMIERIARIVAEGVPVTEILALTFTKSAAAEMRERLFLRLSEMSSDSFIREQLALFPLCSVDTIHGFCADLLRSNFGALGLDPAFSVLDAAPANALLDEAVDGELNSRYEKNSAEFFLLVDAFGRGRRDAGLRKIVKDLYDCAVNTPAPKKFLRSLNEFYTEKYTKTLLSRLNLRYTRTAQYYLRQMLELKELCRTAQMTAYIDALDGLCAVLERISEHKSFEENYKQVLEFSLGSLPAKKKSSNEILAERIGTVKKELTARMKKFREEFGGKSMERLIFERAECASAVQLLGEITLSAAELYEEKKRRLSVLDFSDLEQLALKLLAGDALGEIRGKYRYVFVDEYQDVNELQESIIKKLSAEGSLFMVGDAKQCIYAFRHSNPEIIKRCMAEFSDGVKGVRKCLRRNYRSHSEILDFVNLVFENAATPEFCGADYKDERLECGRTENGGGKRVFLDLVTGYKKRELKRFDEAYPMPYDINAPILDEDAEKADSEALIVAGKVKELLEKGLGYGDIVILCRSMTSRAYAMYKRLSALGVPVSFPAEKVPDAGAEINALVNFLSIINNPLQDIPLAAALTGFLYGLSPDELAAARLTKTEKSHADFFDSLKAYAQTTEGGRVRAFLGDLSRYRAMSKTLSAAELLTKIINEKSVEKHILKKKGGTARAAAMWSFVSALQKGQGAGSLEEFCAYAEAHGKEKVSDGGADGLDCVRMLSVHSAKGLEYPAVILAGLDIPEKLDSGEILTDKEFGAGTDYFDTESRIKTRTINKAVIKDLLDRRSKEESLRVLYVALTRAKEYLFLTGCTDSLPKPCSAALDSFELDRADSFLDIIAALAVNRPSDCLVLTLTDKTELGAGAETAERRVTFPLEDKKRVEGMCASLSFVYPFEAAKTSEYKMAASLAAQIISPPLPRAAKDRAFTSDSTAAQGGNAADTGTLYHKVLCYADLAKSAEDSIASLVSEGTITAEEADSVDTALLQRVLDTDLLKRASRAPHFKEHPFMMLMPAKELDGRQAQGDDVIIQGVIDLMFFENSDIIIADYKFSGLPAEELKRVYGGQLDMYARAAESILERRVTEKHIVNLKTGEIIQV